MEGCFIIQTTIRAGGRQSSCVGTTKAQLSQGPCASGHLLDKDPVPLGALEQGYVTEPNSTFVFFHTESQGIEAEDQQAKADVTVTEVFSS